MNRQLFDIWNEIEMDGTVGWRAQMVNYVAHFESSGAAERCVAATKIAREQAAKSAFNQA